MLVSYVFNCVHFLNFGELKMRFLHITLFAYWKCIVKILDIWKFLFVLQYEISTKLLFSQGD